MVTVFHQLHCLVSLFALPFPFSPSPVPLPFRFPAYPIFLPSSHFPSILPIFRILPSYHPANKH